MKKTKKKEDGIKSLIYGLIVLACLMFGIHEPGDVIACAIL